jgi:hypothetical protein
MRAFGRRYPLGRSLLREFLLPRPDLLPNGGTDPHLTR